MSDPSLPRQLDIVFDFAFNGMNDYERLAFFDYASEFLSYTATEQNSILENTRLDSIPDKVTAFLNSNPIIDHAVWPSELQKLYDDIQLMNKDSFERATLFLVQRTAMEKIYLASVHRTIRPPAPGPS